jgi:hypothetical protein
MDVLCSRLVELLETPLLGDEATILFRLFISLG